MTRLPALGPNGEGWVAVQMVLFVGIAAAGGWLPGHPPSPLAELGITSGVLLILAGGALAVAGSAALRRSDAFTAVPRPLASARLTESGVYGLVRHPIYGGLILAAIGWAALRASFPGLLGAAALAAFFDLKRRREEAWLEARFPAYPAYRRRTRQFIPWIW